jgi:hypothetical protein
MAQRERERERERERPTERHIAGGASRGLEEVDHVDFVGRGCRSIELRTNELCVCATR